MNMSNVLLVLSISSKARTQKRWYFVLKTAHLSYRVPWSFQLLYLLFPTSCGANVVAVTKPPSRWRILETVSQREEPSYSIFFPSSSCFIQSNIFYSSLVLDSPSFLCLYQFPTLDHVLQGSGVCIYLPLSPLYASPF